MRPWLFQSTRFLSPAIVLAASTFTIASHGTVPLTTDLIAKIAHTLGTNIQYLLVEEEIAKIPYNLHRGGTAIQYLLAGEEHD